MLMNREHFWFKQDVLPIRWILHVLSVHRNRQFYYATCITRKTRIDNKSSMSNISIKYSQITIYLISWIFNPQIGIPFKNIFDFVLIQIKTPFLVVKDFPVCSTVNPFSCYIHIISDILRRNDFWIGINYNQFVSGNIRFTSLKSVQHLRRLPKDHNYL